jgi:hypothetical protein
VKGLKKKEEKRKENSYKELYHNGNLKFVWILIINTHQYMLNIFIIFYKKEFKIKKKKKSKSKLLWWIKLWKNCSFFF